MIENLFRSQFDRLESSDKLWLMRTLAARHGLKFRKICEFSRWGQSCTTGVFEKCGREFVFVPGDTITLGWERFAVGMDQESTAELDEVFSEWGIDCTPEEFIGEIMAPVRRADKGGQSLEISQTVRFERDGGGWHAWLCHPTTYQKFRLSLLWEVMATLPTPDEWAYLCGGGCRTLFPWGDGLEYSMHLHHFESEEDRGKPYDMEQANFFGLSIAYDPYKRELVDGETLTTCGGDGGRNICGGMGLLVGYLPCSPHCRPEVRDDDVINNDFDFFRPVIRIQTSGWRTVSP